MGIYLIHLGMGKHIDTIPLIGITPVLKAVFVTQHLYNTGITLAKSSALFFYTRVFNHTSTKFNYTIWAAQIAVWLWLFSLTMTTTFTCIPVQKLWYPEMEGHCRNITNVFLGNVGTSAIGVLSPIFSFFFCQCRRFGGFI